MRTTWIWMSVGILGWSAMVAASPNLSFETVINQGDSFTNDPGDQFQMADQVVAGPGGTVGIVGNVENDSNSAVIFSTPASGDTWTSQTVAVAGDSYTIPPIPSSEDFDAFGNLAITNNLSNGTQLTFEAQDVNNNQGILQWGGSSLEDVAFDGDSKGYSSVGATESASGLPELQVNASAQVMFPAVVSPNNVLVRGDSSSLTTTFTSGASLSITTDDQGDRVALGADNSGAAVITAAGNPGIYTIPAIGGTPTKVSGSFTPASEQPLMGYASGGGINAALFLANGTPSQTNQVVLSQNNGTTLTVLVPQFSVAGAMQPEGQITPNGQIAVYAPNSYANGISTVDAVWHANAASVGPSASVIASVYSGPGSPSSAFATDGSDPTLPIQGFFSGDQGPEINSNGTILMDAEVGTTPSHAKQALLDWLPGDQSPEILLAAGDQVDIDGNMVTIEDFTLNSLSNDYDYFKDGLNDQNDIAIAVDYTGGPNGGGSAVLYAVIPEPSTIALVSIASFGLFARRRRR
jgi:hypothetical protein